MRGAGAVPAQQSKHFTDCSKRVVPCSGGAAGATVSCLVDGGAARLSGGMAFVCACVCICVFPLVAVSHYSRLISHNT